MLYVGFLYIAASGLAFSRSIFLPATKRPLFDLARFLQAVSVTPRMVQVKAGHIFFSQGGLTEVVNRRSGEQLVNELEVPRVIDEPPMELFSAWNVSRLKPRLRSIRGILVRFASGFEQQGWQAKQTTKHLVEL